MQKPAGEDGMEEEKVAIGDAPTASGRFRLPPRTLLLSLLGLLLLIGAGIGGWTYLASRPPAENAAQAKADAQARTLAAEAGAVNAAKDLELLEAARKAHEEILATDTVAAAALSPPALDSAKPPPSLPPAPASQAPASQAPASQAPASQAPASQAPASQAPASQAPASQAPASQAPVMPKGLPVVRAAAKPATPASLPSVANDPAPIGPGGCSLSGGNPKDFGASLGRCLEEYNRMETSAGERKSPRRPSR